MSLKLKALGLGLLAVLVTSGFAVMNAAANGGGGHFTSDAVGTTTLDITEGEGGGEKHRIHFRRTATTPESEFIGCAKSTYTASLSANTVESITVTPHYTECRTTPSGSIFPIHTNGCTYTFTVTKGTVDSTEQEVHLKCPPGKSIQITHPNCTITVHEQSVKNAVTYTTRGGGAEKHWITLDVNAKFNATYHGLCQFIVPTSSTGELIGSITVKGTDKDKKDVNITAT